MAGFKYMSRRRKLVLLIVGVSAVVNGWYRGPAIGLLPFMSLTLPPTLLLAAPLFWRRIPEKVALAVAGVLAISVSYFFCAPPLTRTLFSRYLGMAIPSDIEDLRRWNDNWGRDPAYYLRFQASAETVERIVIKARLTKERPTTPVKPPRMIFSVPQWWNPHELGSLQLWSNYGKGDLWIYLRYDPQTELVYLAFLTT